MSSMLDKLPQETEASQGRGLQIMERFLSVAQPRTVFGEPVTAGAYTVITACEVSIGGGYGYGRGIGPAATAGKEPGAGTPQMATGSGMGAGGGASGRPVAVISIGPDGVKVTPVPDATKIALASITVVGTMVAVLGRVRGLARKA
jgi:uncharacterized spore protein YtfJ